MRDKTDLQALRQSSPLREGAAGWATNEKDRDKDQEVAEYHYRFYHLLATVLGEHWTEAVETGYSRVMRDELNSDVHGEVDEASWRLKQALRRSQATMSAKAFRAYARQSFIDTLTLYLHGICCDIDVDTGPRQLPSRRSPKRSHCRRSRASQPRSSRLPSRCQRKILPPPCPPCLLTP